MALRNKRKLRQIKAIAYDVRRWAECLYDTSCHEDWSPDLCGLCAIASGELTNRLQAAGYPARIAIGFGHCWVEVCGYYLDVTATQFNSSQIFPDVVMTPLANVPSRLKRFQKSRKDYAYKLFDSVEDAQDHMANLGWPEGQQCLGYANVVDFEGYYYEEDPDDCEAVCEN